MANTDLIASLTNQERYLLKSLTETGPLEKTRWGKQPQDPDYPPEVLRSSQQRLIELGLVEAASQGVPTVRISEQGRSALASYEEREGPIVMRINSTMLAADPSAKRYIDVLVVDADMRPIVVVEVKNRENLSHDVAVDLYYRQLETYNVDLHARYLMLASQDRAFLWAPGQSSLPSEPILDFSLEPVIARYIPQAPERSRLTGRDLETIIARWLLDLTDSREDIHTEPEKTLRDVGFIAAIQRTIVLPEVAA